MAVQDNYEWVDGIVTALGDLAPPLMFAPPIEERKRVRTAKRREGHPGPLGLFNASRTFIGRHLLLHKSTVFGIFDLTINETSPSSFTMIVGSAEPAENIQVRDRMSKVVLLDQPLDDERVFMVRIPEALNPQVVASVSVVQDGNINKAYFPLIGDEPK